MTTDYTRAPWDLDRSSPVAVAPPAVPLLPIAPEAAEPDETAGSELAAEEEVD